MYRPTQQPFVYEVEDLIREALKRDIRSVDFTLETTGAEGSEPGSPGDGAFYFGRPSDLEPNVTIHRRAHQTLVVLAL